MAVILLTVALAIGLISSRLRVPYSVSLVVAGIALALVQKRFAPISLGPDSLILFLPPLIFAGAWSLDLSALKRMSVPIAILAGPGAVVAAAVIAAAATYVGGFPFGAALVLGVILAPTDPVAIIAIFRQLRVPVDLAALIEGESIANDGVAIVLYQLIIPIALGVAHPQVGPLLYGFVVSSVGGAAIGLGVAFAVATVLRRTSDNLFQVLGTIIVAYGTYVLAESVHVSGIFATAVSAISLKAFEFFPSNDRANESVEQFWGVGAFIINAVVFLAMGLTLKLNLPSSGWIVPLVVFCAALTARALPSYTVLRLFSVVQDKRWLNVVAASGLRGGLSVVLALGLPASLPNRAAIIDVVFGVVFLTLVLQGIPMSRLVSANTARSEGLLTPPAAAR